MIGLYLLGSLVLATLLFFIRKKIFTGIFLGAFLALQWVLTIHSYTHMGSVNWVYFMPDSVGVLLLIVLSIVAIPAFYHSHVYFVKHPYSPREQGIYYAAMVVLVMALSAAYISNHMAITWIFVELTTLSASALIYHRRNLLTLEGTWKYIFVCSISITLVFIGILLLTIAIQQDGHKDLTYLSLFSDAPHLNVFWLKLAFLFIFTGFTAKAGLVPMYTAGIDAKDKAPYPAAALFSSVLMNVGFLGIFRLYEIISRTSVLPWANKVLMIAGLLSVFVATVYMLRVKNIKRMMAYSSVEHMGLVILGLAAGGVGYYFALLHIVLHSFAKPALFFQFGQIYRTFGSKSVYDVGNYFNYNVTGAVVLLLSYITVTAMPPSGMFISEFMIFRALFESGNLWMLIIILLLLTIIIWSFGKNVFKMLFIKPVGFDESRVERVHPSESISQYILLILVAYLGLNPPSMLVDLLNNAVINLPH
ncbi:MAG TPA: proton-conducting transporter membrane subunit [Bacteroidales bacterium]|nr:proton-conducting transporter membrane subunit [Bacteroidales bacterium]